MRKPDRAVRRRIRHRRASIHGSPSPGAHPERDRTIDGRATRTAYFILLTGMIVVGMVMPFNNAGWKLVNTALLFIVLTETARYVLILIGYRQPRLVR